MRPLRTYRSGWLALGFAALDMAVLVTGTAVLTYSLAHAESHDAWLDRLESRLVTASGQVFPLGQGEALFYAPLAALWMLDKTGAVIDTAVLRREDGVLMLMADNGETVRVTGDDIPLPLASTPTGKAHPLTDFHDRLLSAPLAEAFGTVPAGSRFEVTEGAGGIVHRPDTPAQATLWQSFGNRIAVTHPDGTVTLHGWHEVDAALRGGAE